MTKQEAFNKIVRSLPHTTLCEGCGAIESRCVCPEYYKWKMANDDVCIECTIPLNRRNCELCTLC